ncbi:MAG: asparagine synthetase B [Bacteroidales bacterium]
MIQKLLLLISFYLVSHTAFALGLLIPMDNDQQNHLKAYGITYWVLQNDIDANWLLNYRGGSFLFNYNDKLQEECDIRGIDYTILPEVQVESILTKISGNDVNMDVVKLVKAPKIAVYAPKDNLPWDDAVTLALTYAEIPYDLIYDEEVITGKLSEYDWLHLHHEDFTGQYGKFYASYRNAPWYIKQVKEEEEKARKFGFEKVSQLKLHVAKTIKEYIQNGGFLFAMCSGTDSFDIALAAQNTDICQVMFDGDPPSPHAQKELDYSQTLAFTDFTLVMDPYEYEFSNIDVTQNRKVQEEEDFFTLFDFSAKWDPIPTMLCQNHTTIIPGFMGQTTAYDKDLIKPTVVIMGENKAHNEARYIHGSFGKGTWAFYGGHDPADYRHYVGDPKTNLNNHKNSPGYRLILNNVLFPAAKKKPHKT